MPRLLLLAAVSLLALPARADDSGQVLITYEAAVGARRISGVSRTLQWNATALPDAGAQVRLLVPLDSFESGHAAFDALLRTAAQAERFPAVEVEGIARNGGFDGVVTLRGVSRPLQARVPVARVDGRVVAHAQFSILLSEFGISVPNVGDKLLVEFVARLPAAEHAVVSGGAVSSAR